MREADLRRMWEMEFPDCLSPAAVIVVTGGERHGTEGDIGLAVHIGENLAELWQSDDVIAFWPDGDHTVLEGLEFEVLTPNVFFGRNNRVLKVRKPRGEVTEGCPWCADQVKGGRCNNCGIDFGTFVVKSGVLRLEMPKKDGE